jgi:hypothetical protein
MVRGRHEDTVSDGAAWLLSAILAALALGVVALNIMD